MTRAMTEGLEGLVLKDVNVMSTKVPFMLLTCIFCVMYMKLYMFYEIKLLNSIPLFFFLLVTFPLPLVTTKSAMAVAKTIA